LSGSGAAVPPGEMRKTADIVFKRRSPFGRVEPRHTDSLMSLRIWGSPPAMDAFFNLPSAKKITERLSPAQNNEYAPSVPVSGRALRESSERIQICAWSVDLPMNASCPPCGEMA